MATTISSAVADAAVHAVAPSASPAARHGALSILNKIGSFPSRFIARMQLIDELLEQDAERQAAALAAALNDPENSQAQRLRPSGLHVAGVTPMPGPWGFFASWYAVGLFIMTFLIHRIQNIVVPPRHLRQRRPSPERGPWAWTQQFLPLDLSSSRYRTFMRIPTLYFLIKNILLWTTVLLQTAGLYPSWKSLRGLGDWAASMTMEQLCWSTFVSVCTALVVVALNRGLEGTGSNNASSFNLFGYAFMLHIYASPITHVDKVAGAPSRPDKHVLVTIILPLIQLTLLHAIGVNRRWSQQRLIPTGICALLTLAHFHYVTFFSSSIYPLLGFVPCAIESLLLCATLITAGLSALTQLLLTGRVSGPLLGHAGALRPRWDEDFSVALLRLGTASIDATAAAGLGNEVNAVHAGALAPGHVHLSRTGVAMLAKGPEQQSGFANELTRVNTRAVEGDMWGTTMWYRELARYALSWLRFARGSVRWARALWKGEPPAHGHGREHSAPPAPATDPDHLLEDADDSDDPYGRFLRGDALSDDDSDADADFVPRVSRRGTSVPLSEPGTPDAASDAESGGEEDGTGADVRETAGLYADHLASAGGGAPLLIAHMTDASPGPLTRRRYARLAAPRTGSAPPDREELAWARFAAQRRAEAEERHAADVADNSERGHACVVCTVEPRQVILWPCRCLALCDDCRSNLATRSSAANHMCPCCRQHVEGYSRIYIP